MAFESAKAKRSREARAAKKAAEAAAAAAETGVGDAPAGDEEMQAVDPVATEVEPVSADDEAFVALAQKSNELEEENELLKKELQDSYVEVVELTKVADQLHETVEQLEKQLAEYKDLADGKVQQAQAQALVGQNWVKDLTAQITTLQTQLNSAQGGSAGSAQGPDAERAAKLEKQVAKLEKQVDKLKGELKLRTARLKFCEKEIGVHEADAAHREFIYGLPGQALATMVNEQQEMIRLLKDPSATTVLDGTDSVMGLFPRKQAMWSSNTSTVPVDVLGVLPFVNVESHPDFKHQVGRAVYTQINSGVEHGEIEEFMVKDALSCMSSKYSNHKGVTIGKVDISMCVPVIHYKPKAKYQWKKVINMTPSNCTKRGEFFAVPGWEYDMDIYIPPEKVPGMKPAFIEWFDNRKDLLDMPREDFFPRMPVWMKAKDKSGGFYPCVWLGAIGPDLVPTNEGGASKKRKREEVPEEEVPEEDDSEEEVSEEEVSEMQGSF